MDGSLTISNALLLAIVAAIGGALTMGGRMFIAALRKNGNGHRQGSPNEAMLRQLLEEVVVSRFHDLAGTVGNINTAAQLYYQSTETMKLQLEAIRRTGDEMKVQLEVVRVRLERSR